MGAIHCFAGGEGGDTGVEDCACEVHAEGERWFCVAFIVLVEALGVEEVDVGGRNVGYFYHEAFW